MASSTGTSPRSRRTRGVGAGDFTGHGVLDRIGLPSRAGRPRCRARRMPCSTRTCRGRSARRPPERPAGRSDFAAHAVDPDAAAEVRGLHEDRGAGASRARAWRSRADLRAELGLTHAHEGEHRKAGRETSRRLLTSLSIWSEEAGRAQSDVRDLGPLEQTLQRSVFAGRGHARSGRRRRRREGRRRAAGTVPGLRRPSRRIARWSTASTSWPAAAMPSRTDSAEFSRATSCSDERPPARTATLMAWGVGGRHRVGVDGGGPMAMVTGAPGRARGVGGGATGRSRGPTLLRGVRAARWS